MATGLIDSAENNEVSYRETGHYRIAPHLSSIRFSFSPGVLLMSKLRWDRLNEADRTLFRQTAVEVAAELRQQWPARTAAARAALTAEGVEIADTVDEMPFIAAMQPVYDRFTSDPVVRDMISHLQASP